jgi:hypothetical protein
MKKIILIFLMGLSIFTVGFAMDGGGNGYMYLENVNNVFGSKNKVQFKVVVKTEDGQEVKSIETREIPAKKYAKFRLADFDLDQGSIDFYARDLEKSVMYNLCVEGLPFSKGVLIVIHGWSESKNAACELAEDAT